MILSQVLKVFDYFIVCEDKEAVPCVLITLSIEFSSNRSFDSFDFVLIVLFFVNFYTAAAEVKPFANAYLPPYCSRFAILIPHEVELVNKLFQVDTLFVQVIIITDNSSTYEHVLASDGIGWI